MTKKVRRNSHSPKADWPMLCEIIRDEIKSQEEADEIVKQIKQPQANSLVKGEAANE